MTIDWRDGARSRQGRRNVKRDDAIGRPRITLTNIEGAFREDSEKADSIRVHPLGNTEVVGSTVIYAPGVKGVRKDIGNVRVEVESEFLQDGERVVIVVRIES